MTKNEMVYAVLADTSLTPEQKVTLLAGLTESATASASPATETKSAPAVPAPAVPAPAVPAPAVPATGVYVGADAEPFDVRHVVWSRMGDGSPVFFDPAIVVTPLYAGARKAQDAKEDTNASSTNLLQIIDAAYRRRRSAEDVRDACYQLTSAIAERAKKGGALNASISFDNAAWKLDTKGSRLTDGGETRRAVSSWNQYMSVIKSAIEKGLRPGEMVPLPILNPKTQAVTMRPSNPFSSIGTARKAISYANKLVVEKAAADKAKALESDPAIARQNLARVKAERVLVGMLGLPNDEAETVLRVLASLAEQVDSKLQAIAASKQANVPAVGAPSVPEKKARKARATKPSA